MTRTAFAHRSGWGSRRPSPTEAEASGDAEAALRRRASSTSRAVASTRWTS
jgi:hypothetical protein